LRVSKFFAEDIQPDEALRLAEQFNFLVSQEGWAVWEGNLRDKRQAALEEIAVSEPALIPGLQGYVRALTDVLEAPAQALALAKAVVDQGKPAEAPKRVLRLAYPDADPAE